MMSGVPLETCSAFNKLWNNKFYYKAASCWYFYWIIHDARIHEYQISLVLELWSQCTLQKTRGLHGRQLLCKFLTDNFNGRLVSSASQCALTIVDFWHWRVNKLPTHFRPARSLSRHRTTVRIIKDLTVKMVLVLFKSNLLYLKFFNKTFEICYILLSHCCKYRMLFGV